MPAVTERLDNPVVTNGKSHGQNFTFYFSFYIYVKNLLYLLLLLHTILKKIILEEPTNEVEVKEKKGEPTPWTPAEQKLLEQALKTYPASASDRWDQISACIPSRSKKECMKRYKVQSTFKNFTI